MNAKKYFPGFILAKTFRRDSLLRRAVALAATFSFTANVLANPTGMTVQSGHATLSVNGSQLTVNAGNGAILNWQSFNIGAGEATTFNQPNAGSIVWNRIGGQSASQIYGSLHANGVVVLLNSSGFYFGPNSFVSAAGLVVSTANCMPPQNSGGSWEFNGPPPLASIVNYGQIKIGNGGDCFLIADKVENHGEIETSGGNIGLAAGQTVTLSERPDGRGMSMNVLLPQGSVDNYGNLIADGGTIALNAKVVNQNGLIQANSVQNKNGVIELVADDTVNLGANSQIIAQGDNSIGGSTGGNVTIQAGNNFGDSAGSSIVTAGGANGGNGGNVEISAPNILSLNSAMNAGARIGFTGGQFLLDPANIVLGTSGNGAPDGSGTVAYNSGSGTLNINVNTAFLNKKFSQILLQAFSTTASSGNITLNPGVTWNLSTSTGESSGTLTLEASGNIILGNGSLLTDTGGWVLNLLAGVSFPAATVNLNKGNIDLNGSNGGSGSGTIQFGQGAVNLSAGNSIQLGSGSVLTTGGGNLTLNAGNNFSDASGNVETGGTAANPTGAAGDISIAAANFSIGGQLANWGTGGLTLNYGGTTFSLGPIYSHLNSSQITLESKNDISLDSSVAWNLSDSTGLNSGHLILAAGGNIAFQYDNGSQIGASIFDGNDWSVSLYVGVVNFATPTPTIKSGIGSISFFDGTGQILPSNGNPPSGSIQMFAGDVNLVAGQDITLGSGVINTTGGGNINLHALAGNIDTGSYAQGYIFQSASSASQGYLIENIGGVSTLAGGDVNLTAGGNVSSVLPANNGYYYDGNYIFTGSTDGTAGSGAYGRQAGNVNIVAGGNVTGNYLVANGVGSIYAGAKMDANGNPVVDGSGKYVLSSSGSAGTDQASPDLALSLINGGWNVTAAQNIILQEVRNPNGVFNINNGGADHAFDYGLDDYVNLTAGNLVQLGASSAILPRLNSSDDVAVPFLYPSILNVNAGAGGVALVGDNIFNQLILYPSPAGSLTIDTAGGGSLIGSLPSSGGVTQIYNLIVSDGDPAQYNNNVSLAGILGLSGNAATPIHLGQATPVDINVSGDMDQIFLSSPEAAQVNVVGNMNNCRFQGMNLNASDVTSITVGQVAKQNMEDEGILSSATDGGLVVGGNINNRSAFTSIDLNLVAGAQAPDLTFLTQAITPPNAPSVSTLLASFYYNPDTKTLTYQNIPGVNLATVLNLLQNLTIQIYNNGVPQWANPPYDTVPLTTTVSVLNAATAQALLNEYTSLGTAASGTYGYTIGGGGKFEITANNIDLGTTAGIQSVGVGYYRNSGGYPLAKLFSEGADISVNLTGDLTMYSTSIASLNGGNININAGGNVEVGSSEFSVTSLGARGIYTSAQGNVGVYAGGNVDINGSRIAGYNGGNVTVESRYGNISAGSGGNGYVRVFDYIVNPITHAVTTDAPTIPGSGILTTTFPNNSGQIVGNILVEALNGSISASAGGMVQLPLNNTKSPDALVQALAGLELHNLNGDVLSAANINQPTLQGALTTATASDLPDTVLLQSGNVTTKIQVSASVWSTLNTVLNLSPAANQDLKLSLLGGDQTVLKNVLAGNGSGLENYNYASFVSAGRNIDASGSGVIGSNIKLNATGDILGVIFARNNISLTAQQNVNVTALAQGTISANAGQNLTGTLIGIGGISASGDSITAALESNSAISGDTSGAKGLAQGTVANSTSAAMSSDDTAKNTTTDNGTDDGDLTKKKKGIALAQKVSRVTVLLPEKKLSEKTTANNPL